ncbi:MAG TPA: hypothetical protein PKV35_10515 [bacterium]|nr:hypothetical protein [bacterium]
MFENYDEVFSYTRAQSIEDGVLIDISESAKAFFKVPVAITNTAFETVKKTMKDETLLKFQLLLSFRQAVDRGQRGEQVNLEFRNIKLKALSHPGDHGEHVITIMLPDED